VPFELSCTGVGVGLPAAHFVGVFAQGAIPESYLRPRRVELDPPLLDPELRLVQGRDPDLVQPLIAELVGGSLRDVMLYRLAGLDEAAAPITLA
jgi:hypothetical protein